jgi:hypothetical protein
MLRLGTASSGPGTRSSGARGQAQATGLNQCQEDGAPCPHAAFSTPPPTIRPLLTLTRHPRPSPSYTASIHTQTYPDLPPEISDLEDIKGTLNAQAKLLATLSAQVIKLTEESMERKLLAQHHQIPHGDAVPPLQPLVINGISYYPRPQ